MNYVVVFILSLVIGYIAYPGIFPQESKGGESLEKVTVTDGDGNRMSFDIDINSITEEEMPDEVRTLEAVELKNQGGMTLKLERNYKAKVLGFGGGMVRITDQTGKFFAEIPFQQTDIIKSVGRIRANKILGIEPEADTKEKEMAHVIEEEEALAKEQEAILAKEKEEALAREAEEKAKAEAAEKEAMEASSSGPLTTTLDEAALVTLMQDSIQKRKVSEFTTEGVLKWDTGDNETIGDTEYQIGFATYEKDTIFGKQPVVAKALVRNGNLTKWVYAKTGLDIR